MTEQPSNVNRRFTIWELVAYVSAFGVLFGVARMLGPLGHNPLTAFLMLVPIPILFGSLVGLGVTVLIGGRRSAVMGAVIGGIAVAVFSIEYYVRYISMLAR